MSGDSGRKAALDELTRLGEELGAPAMRHVDDFIDDPTSDPYAARWLGLFRRPAREKLREPNEDKLFATHEGQRWRVIGCSRFGDVWLTSNFRRADGYEYRVCVDECSDWSATP